jgi:hypothetical protein
MGDTPESPISALRWWLYLAARILGDLSALRRGPNTMVKRLARQQAGRLTARMLEKWFR